MINRRGIILAQDELDEIWEKRIIDADINVLGLGPDFRVISPENMSKMLTEGEFGARIQRLRDHGVEIEWEFHALCLMLPRDLFESHPEYFRVNDEGVRTADFNLCASSDEGLERLSQGAEEMAKFFFTENGRYHIWLDDTAKSACYCDKCKDLSRADQALITYNAILRGLKRYDPNAKLCYLAYHDANNLPTKVKPDPGIFLEYAPFTREFDSPIYNTESEKNEREHRYLKDLLALFGTEGSQVLDYWLDNSLFSDWKKPPKEFKPHTETMRADIKYYYDLGFQTVTAYGCYLGKEYMELYDDPTEHILAYGQALKDVH